MATSTVPPTESPPRPQQDPTSQTILLSDGRTLGYASYGSTSPNAPTILYFPGTGSCRHEALIWATEADAAGARLLSLDRPGVGLSSPDPAGTVLSFANDVLQLSQQLDLAPFHILGLSGGAPFALACAKVLPPSLLAGMGIVSGLAPLHQTGTAGMALQSRALFGTLAWLPGALTQPLLSWLMARQVRGSGSGAEAIREHIRKNLHRACEPDRAVFSDPAFVDQLIATEPELLRDGGADAVARELVMVCKHWGFELAELELEGVRLWYGAEDTGTPAVMGRRLAEELRGPRLCVMEGEGHISIVVRHGGDVLRAMLGGDVGPGTETGAGAGAGNGSPG